ncbi:MAG: excisionase family DNA-binding protein [Pseudomonadota bacterium]
MTNIDDRDDLIVPDESDSELAKTASRVLARARDQRITVRLDDGTELFLPKMLTELMVQMLTELSYGNAVTIVPIHAELTTQEAANHLNVSRPFLIKQLEKGALPFHKVGSHRRVKFTDLRVFRAEFENRREAAMQSLATEAQELGLGY